MTRILNSKTKDLDVYKDMKAACNGLSRTSLSKN